jgi:hypothetical protein
MADRFSFSFFFSYPHRLVMARAVPQAVVVAMRLSAAS